MMPALLVDDHILSYVSEVKQTHGLCQQLMLDPHLDLQGLQSSLMEFARFHNSHLQNLQNVYC